MTSGNDGIQNDIERGGQLAPELRIALSRSRPADRPLYAAILTLDLRLSEIWLRTSEPIFAQMRLAWWRDEFVKDADTVSHEPLLASLRHAFPQDQADLAALVDGWEALLLDDRDDNQRIDQFVAGRAGVFAVLARRLGDSDHVSSARKNGALWALARAAAGDFPENAVADAMVRFDAGFCRLPRRLRPLAVLGGLSARALIRKETSLIGDRLSPLAALRLGLFGR